MWQHRFGANKGDPFTVHEIEHISIAVMFAFAGTLGLLLESKSIRNLIARPIAQRTESNAEVARVPPSYSGSFKPFTRIDHCPHRYIYGSASSKLCLSSLSACLVGQRIGSVWHLALAHVYLPLVCMVFFPTLLLDYPLWTALTKRRSIGFVPPLPLSPPDLPPKPWPPFRSVPVASCSSFPWRRWPLPPCLITPVRADLVGRLRQHG